MIFFTPSPPLFFFFGIDLEKKEELRIHLEKTLLKD